MPSVIRSICIPLDLYRKLQIKAKKQGKSVNRLIREYLTIAVQEDWSLDKMLDQKIQFALEKALSEQYLRDLNRKRHFSSPLLP